MDELKFPAWEESTTSGPSLDRHIAEILGYRVIDTKDRYNRFVLVDPDGNACVKLYDKGGPTIEHAWAMAIVNNQALPRWSSSTDAALTLIPEGSTFSMSRTSLDWGATIYKEGKPCYGAAKNPALAICRAWLVYQDTVSA